MNSLHPYRKSRSKIASHKVRQLNLKFKIRQSLQGKKSATYQWSSMPLIGNSEFGTQIENLKGGIIHCLAQRHARQLAKQAISLLTGETTVWRILKF